MVVKTNDHQNSAYEFSKHGKTFEGVLYYLFAVFVFEFEEKNAADRFG